MADIKRDLPQEVLTALESFPEQEKALVMQGLDGGSFFGIGMHIYNSPEITDDQKEIVRLLSRLSEDTIQINNYLREDSWDNVQIHLQQASDDLQSSRWFSADEDVSGYTAEEQAVFALENHIEAQYAGFDVQLDTLKTELAAAGRIESEELRKFWDETASSYGYDGSIFIDTEIKSNMLTEDALAQTPSFQKAVDVLFEKENNGATWESLADENGLVDGQTIGEWGIHFMSQQDNQLYEVAQHAVDFYTSDEYSQDQKVAFLYASQSFRHTQNDWGSFGRALGYTVTDEANLVSAAAAVFTLGASVAATQGAKIAAQRTFMSAVGSTITSSVDNIVVRSAAKTLVGAEATGGALDGGLRGDMDQNNRIATGQMSADEYSYAPVVMGAGLGAAVDTVAPVIIGAAASTLTRSVTSSVTPDINVPSSIADAAVPPIASPGPRIDATAPTGPTAPEFTDATAGFTSVADTAPNIAPANSASAPVMETTAPSAPHVDTTSAPIGSAYAGPARATRPGQLDLSINRGLAAAPETGSGTGTPPPTQTQVPQPDPSVKVETSSETPIDFTTVKPSRIEPQHVDADGFRDHFEELSTDDIGRMTQETLQAAFDKGYFKGLSPDQKDAAIKAKNADDAAQQAFGGGQQAAPEAVAKPEPTAEAKGTEPKGANADADAEVTPNKPSLLGRTLNVHNWFNFQTQDIIVNRDTPLEGGKWPSNKYNIYERNLSVISTPNMKDDSYVDSTGKLINGNFFRMENNVKRLEDGKTDIQNRASIVQSLLERGYVNAAIEGLRNAQIKGNLEPALIAAIKDLNGPAKHITDKQYEFIRYILKEGAPDFTKKLARNVTASWTPGGFGLDYTSYIRYPRTTLWNIGYYFKGDKLPEGMNSIEHESNWIPRLKGATGKDGEKLQGMTSGDFGNAGRIVGRSVGVLTGWTPTVEAVKFVGGLPFVKPFAIASTVAWLATNAVDNYNNNETNYSAYPDAVQMGLANAGLTVAEKASALGTLPTGIAFGSDALVSQPAQELNSGINYVQDWVNGAAANPADKLEDEPALSQPGSQAGNRNDQPTNEPDTQTAGGNDPAKDESFAAGAAADGSTPSDGGTPQGGDAPADPAAPASNNGGGRTLTARVRGNGQTPSVAGSIDAVLPADMQGTGAQVSNLASQGWSSGKGLLSAGFNKASDFYNYTLPAMVGEEYAGPAKLAMAGIAGWLALRFTTGVWTGVTNINYFKVGIGLAAAVGIAHFLSGRKDGTFSFDSDNNNRLAFNRDGIAHETMNDNRSDTSVPLTVRDLPNDPFNMETPSRPGAIESSSLIQQPSSLDRAQGLRNQFAGLASAPSLAPAGPNDIVVPDLNRFAGVAQGGATSYMPAGTGNIDAINHEGSFDVAGIPERDFSITTQRNPYAGLEHRTL